MKLLSAWSAEGFSPGEFWAQTSESWSAIMEGRRQFHQAKADGDTALAWMVAVFSRTDKLEPLDKYIRRKKVPQTLEEVFAQWDALATAGYGIKITDMAN